MNMTKCESSKWHKFIAVSIIAILSTGLGRVIN
jgi:hypothetical protein